MPETKAKTKALVHHDLGYDPETELWHTSCGLSLDKEARAETVLAYEMKNVTCRDCKSVKPEVVDREAEQEVDD